MAVTSMMQRLLDNALTAKFAKSLKHSDLPEGWADNPEIVQLAEDAYSVMGTESPWFKAWSNANKVVDKEGRPFQVLHGTDADIYAFRGDKGNFFTPSPSYSYIQNSDKVYPAYLSLQNPLRTENKYIAETANTFWDEVHPELTAKGYDGIVYASDKDIMKGASGWGDDVPQMVAFSPTQIKSPFNRGTFNPADPNFLRGIIPALGAGGLLALMGPEEAEAAVEDDFVKKFVKAAEKAAKKEPGAEVVLGETPEEAFSLLKEIYPGLNDPVARIVYPHGVVSRADQMTPLQQALLYANAYRDNTLKAIRNKPGNDRSDAALWHQGQKISSFFPVKEQNGHPLILTGMPKKTKDIQKYLVENHWGLGGRTEDPSILVTPQSLGIEVPSGQPVRTFSAVSPNMGNTIRGLDAWGKRNLPKVAGAATGAALPFLSPDEVEAERARYAQLEREQALGSPLVDPADLLTAPIGVPTAALKAASVAAEPFISYGMDKAINGLLGLFDDEE